MTRTLSNTRLRTRLIPSPLLIASALTLCVAIAAPLRVHAQAAAVSARAALVPASAMAAPDLECTLHARGSAPDSGITVFTDGDGYARFFAVRSAAAQVLTCTNGSKQTTEYAVDLASASTFADRPLDIAKEPGIERPPLAGDPLTISQAELSRGGYGLRPDPDTPQYAKWLEAARRPGRMLLARKPDKHVHAVTTTTGAPWVGSVLTGSAPYTWITSTFRVPTVFPGADGTTSTVASIWPGLGGFGTGSGLIQAGVSLQTTPTTASYSTWREYCCGDGDSNGYGGAFTPQPGDDILAQAWYCDATGQPSLNGGFGCSFVFDYKSGAVFSCTQPRGTPGSTPCWSVKALPTCASNPQAPNCMNLGRAAEFIIENQSPQLTPPTDQFPRFTPFAMQGYARTNNGTVTVGSDPTVFLLADFPHGRPHVTVTLSPDIATTTFSADSWSGFVVAPAGNAGVNSHVASVSRQRNTMEVFSIGANGSVQDAYWYEGMPSWKRFEIAPGQSAASASGIAAVSRIPNSMEIFWIAPNGSVQDAYWYEGMPSWKRQELAPPGSAATTSSVAAVSRIHNSLEIFWTAPNGSVHDAYWYEGMPSWKSFEIARPGSASVDGGLTAVSRNPKTMEIFWAAPNGSIQDAYWYEGMPAWKSFEIAPANSASSSGSITSVSRKPETMEIFWTAANGSVQDAYWYEGMPAWKRFEIAPPGAASVKGDIKAVSRRPETLEVWWVGANGSIQDAYWYENTSWSRFDMVTAGRAATGGGVTAVSRMPNSMEVWWIGADGSVVDSFYYDL